MLFEKGYKPWNKGSKKGWTTKKCERCGKDFECRKAEIKRGGARFCGHRCSGLHSAELHIKPTEAYSSKTRKKERIIRDLKAKGITKCQIPGCEWNLTLDAHRINPGKNGGQYEVDNMILICPNHHSLITRKIMTIKELFGRVVPMVEQSACNR